MIDALQHLEPALAAARAAQAAAERRGQYALAVQWAKVAEPDQPGSMR